MTIDLSAFYGAKAKAALAEIEEKIRKMTETAQADPVDHPSHYNSLPAVCSECGHPIECIDVVRHKDFNTGNAIKYIWRAGFKHEADEDPREAGLEDLKKAIWYLENEIELMQTQLDTERASRES